MKYLFLLFILACSGAPVGPNVTHHTSFQLFVDSLVDSVRAQVADSVVVVPARGQRCVIWDDLPLPQLIHLRGWDAGLPDTGATATLAWRREHVGRYVRVGVWQDAQGYYWVHLTGVTQECGDIAGRAP